MKIIGDLGYELSETLIRAGERPGLTEDTIERTLRCTKEDCDVWSQGCALWLGGVVDSATHVQLLQERLGRTCRAVSQLRGPSCPHPAAGLTTD